MRVLGHFGRMDPSDPSFEPLQHTHTHTHTHTQIEVEAAKQLESYRLDKQALVASYKTDR